MPVPATRFLRHMRGGAQAHLLEAGDGHFYVTKFRENPQHLRILVNEWIAARLIEYLQIAAPAAAIVELDQSFLARELDVRIRLAARETPVQPAGISAPVSPAIPIARRSTITCPTRSSSRSTT